MTPGPGTARRKLAAPTVAMLPRINDSLSFLYLDIVRIHQDDTGVCAEVTSERHATQTVYLPTAALSCVLLGPGTSITSRALATFARHGTTVLITGSGGVRCYAATQPASLTTTWLERQTRAWADDTRRLTVAKAMYEKRFGPGTATDATSLDTLRGMEGQRVKTHYQLLARQYKIGRFRRAYDPASWDTQDPVNLALSSANTCLYGIVHAAILALGCSPALGFVHNGNQQALVYDIADLYKAELTIPLAFSLHASTNPEAMARRSFRTELRLFRLLPRIVTDIQQLLDPENKYETPDPEEHLVDLWDPVVGAIPGGINHGLET
ncbi:type I-E CRISPR-associated endonuclease Cas1e [Streptomyces sp. NBC_01500]|uniref:type I-E CRISPR-associated endonuclease Cas1e n=1 Tax=Streptomyces sp. NBC_01500 TaxID=2903886 RepID=UPI0022550D07|nr:type I-E CRISPR-associated endonuclease Cas1e [Streptomyces sp. NBC_01500]MCX4554282.1 type I-E CRISPR-associated endonuclease Cas1e [Streptomyces sp. NBC_01500]